MLIYLSQLCGTMKVLESTILCIPFTISWFTIQLWLIPRAVSLFYCLWVNYAFVQCVCFQCMAALFRKCSYKEWKKNAFTQQNPQQTNLCSVVKVLEVPLNGPRNMVSLRCQVTLKITLDQVWPGWRAQTWKLGFHGDLLAWRGVMSPELCCSGWFNGFGEHSENLRHRPQ